MFDKDNPLDLKAIREEIEKQLGTKPRPQDVQKTLEAAERWRRQKEEIERKQREVEQAVNLRMVQQVIPVPGQSYVKAYDSVPILVTEDQGKAIDAMGQRVGMSPEDFRQAVQDLFDKDLRPVIQSLAQQMIQYAVRQALDGEIRQQIREFVSKQVQNQVKVKVSIGPEIDTSTFARGYAGLTEDNE